MPQTQANKITTPVNSDAYNLAADLATMANTTNAVIRVNSQSERDGLTKVAGLTITRADLSGLIEVCDGTAWNSPVKRRHAEFTASGDGTTGAGSAWQLAVVTEDSSAAGNNSFVSPSTGKSRIRFNEAGCYSITLKLAASSSPGFFYGSIKDSSDTIYYADGNNGGGADWGCTASIPNLLIPAATTEILFGLRTANSVTVSARITVQKISD
jgi:hypothetical protein